MVFRTPPRERGCLLLYSLFTQYFTYRNHYCSSIDKYVIGYNEKVYACFVDIWKTFDSVWHDGLLQINVGGNVYKLIKSLYSNSICSIKIGNHQTRSFQYARDVRQGCILSHLYSLICTLMTFRSHFKIRYQTLLFYQTERN